ncbi:MAG: hypothetical protein JJE03_00350 [Peptostreptococcaceae bacterium]|nr:hypothetical protein [Peptostreptococcaceae bacterium]
MNYLKLFWEAEIQIIPILVMFTIYIFPNKFMKHKDLHYAPIYFYLPPFSNLNNLIARYDEIEHSNDYSKDENAKDKVIKKIKKASKFSLLFEGFFWPIVFGFISGLIISNKILTPLILIILLLRLYQFAKSTFDFRKENYDDNKSWLKLMFIYIIFTYVSLNFIYIGYDCMKNFLLTKDFCFIISTINHNIIINLFFLPILSFLMWDFIKSTLIRK